MDLKDEGTQFFFIFLEHNKLETLDQERDLLTRTDLQLRICHLNRDKKDYLFIFQKKKIKNKMKKGIKVKVQATAAA